MFTADHFIQHLNLEQHVEGGYYRETYRSPLTANQRSLSTAIYFLLEGDQLSRFHRLTADEIWFFHYGSPLLVHQIDKTGRLFVQKLGMDFSAGESPQLLIPAGTIFASETADKNSFSLVSCMVSPGFEFDDFKLFTKEELKAIHPQHQEAIERLAV